MAQMLWTFLPVAGAACRVGESAWLKRAQQACGAVLVGLGVRLAFERR